MKTEEFDDAIKRKLESINPVFNEKDIDRVHQYSIRNRGPLSALRSSRSFWSLMGAGMIVTAILTWKITTMYVQSHPVSQQAVNQNLVQNLPKSTEPKTITKTDTVYLSKSTNPKSDKYPSYQAYKAFNENSNGVAAQKINRKYSNGSSTRLYASTQTPINTKNNSNGLTNNNLSGYYTNASNNKTEENSTGNTGQSPSQSKTNYNIAQSNETTAKTADNQNETKDQPLKTVKKEPIHNYSEEHSRPGKTTPLLKLGAMAGLGGEYANTQFGAGLFVKIIANNRLSLNAGLKNMSVNHHNYKDDEAYMEASGYDLKKYYARQLSPSCEITDIDFTYSLWQIPVSIEYYFPLKNSLTLSVAAGTDMDISCISTLKYTATESYASDGPKPYNQTYNYSTVLFNNLGVSVGITKQWHQFAFELSPFISPQITKAWYKGTNTLFYGMNLKAFYCF